MDYKLDDYERELSENLSDAESILDENLKKDIEKSALEHVESRNVKNKSVTLRMSGHDLEIIKRKASNAGLPYQTLIGLLLHKYADGDININL